LVVSGQRQTLLVGDWGRRVRVGRRKDVEDDKTWAKAARDKWEHGAEGRGVCVGGGDTWQMAQGVRMCTRQSWQGAGLSPYLRICKITHAR